MEAEHKAFICTEYSYRKTYSHLIVKLEQLKKDGYLNMLDIRPVFFRNGEFKAIRDGVQFFRDSNHFTVEGSIIVADCIGDDLYHIIKGDISTSL